MGKLLLAVLFGTIVLFALDYYREGNNFSLSNSWKKYALAFLVMAGISFFLKEPIMQYFLIVLGTIGFGRIMAGIDKVQQIDTVQRTMAFGTSMYEAERKEENALLAILLGATLIIFSLTFFGKENNIALAAKQASFLANFFGGIFIIGSWLLLYVGSRLRWGSWTAIAWIVLLGFGVATAGGFNFPG